MEHDKGKQLLGPEGIIILLKPSTQRQYKGDRE